MSDLASIFNRGGGLTDPDAAPPRPADPVSRRGDLWLLGRHRLLCGDATAPADVRRLLDPGNGREGLSPRLMVTDPPYGVGYDANWRNEAARSGATFGRARGVIGARAIGVVRNDDRADWSAAWALFPGVVAYVWHGGLHAGPVEVSLAGQGLITRAQIVWIKTRPVISRGAYHWQHEPALYAVRGEDDAWNRFQPEHEVAGYAVRKGGTANWQGGRRQSTVWFIEHIKSDTGHSTQKPVACMQRPMENNSLPGDVVYDPFCGSGSSLIAAEQSARNLAALEIDPGYCDVAVLRWSGFTGEAVVNDRGQTFEQVRAARLAQVASGRKRRRTAA